MNGHCGVVASVTDCHPRGRMFKSNIGVHELKCLMHETHTTRFAWFGLDGVVGMCLYLLKKTNYSSIKLTYVLVVK